MADDLVEEASKKKWMLIFLAKPSKSLHSDG